MSNSTLPQGPLYGPKGKVRNFKFHENFENIRLNLTGTGLLYEDPSFYYFLGEDKEWRRPKEICSSPYFINGKPTRFDANQGLMGDCYLINGIEALTLNDELIEHVVPPNQSFDTRYIGVFHFRLWKFGTWYDVIVDDRLPILKQQNMLSYAHSKSGDVFWAALLEKAYAKFYGGGSTSYDNLKGGYAITAFQDLSGGMIENIRVTNPLPTTTIQALVEKAFAKKALMSCVPLKADKGLLEHHGYTVTKMIRWSESDPDYHGLYFIRLMNPWGSHEWQGAWSDDDYDLWRQIDRGVRDRIGVTQREDGEFWMSMDDFVKYFVVLSVCHLGPGQYLESRNINVDFSTWRSQGFLGEWIKGVSAGGSPLATRHLNPQYIVHMDFPENDTNRDGLSVVVIELTQRSKYNRLDIPEIAFYVYSLKKLQNIPTPLDKTFFENHKPMDENPNFKSSEGRAFLSTMQLECPAKYCIVPCTRVENKETRFILRVFSESRISLELWENDTQISKMILSEQVVKEFDQGLKIQFYEVSQGEDEIDWIGLRQILNKCMSPSRFGSGIVTSIFNFIFKIFESNNSILFTKDECRSMIAMFDDNHLGTLSFQKFNDLWNKISFWTEVYEKHRDEVERHLKISQLRDALGSIGFEINKFTINMLSNIYASEEGNISLTDFILCGVSLDTLLSFFPEKGQQNENKIKFTLEEWIKRTLLL